MAEKYLELYKKYRPRTWDEVIGQDTVVKSLKQALETDKIPTAYIFSGGAGTGKTTSAFILAKALNCETPVDKATPCNKCKTCKAIDEDRQFGFRYLSMANNGKVESIRQIMEDSRLAQPVKKKVYILDEVQNCERKAFDAMLISLESETQDTLFIMCTTDPHKIPPAIQSRAQVRTFNSAKPKDLGKLLVNICKQEGIPVDKENLKKAVLTAKGSVRTAIRNLELLSSGGEIPSSGNIKLLNSIVSKDLRNILETITELVESGNNPVSIAESLYNDVTYIFIALSGGPLQDPSLEEAKSKLNTRNTLSLLNNLGDSMKAMSNKQVDYTILLRVALTKWITENA